MPSRLFRRNDRYKHWLRLVRLQVAPARALIARIDESQDAEQAASALAAFYGEAGPALERARLVALVPAPQWRMHGDLVSLGATEDLRLTQYELAQFEQLVRAARSAPDAAVEVIREQIAIVLGRARLREQDPDAVARAWVDDVLAESEGLLEPLAEAALEVCTGPDPLLLDIELDVLTPHVFGHGPLVITPQDRCTSVVEASLALDEDLELLAESCATLESRLDPELDRSPRRLLSDVARLVETARELHVSGAAGLLILRMRDPWS